MEEKENVVSINWVMVAKKTFQLSIFVGLAVVAPYFSNQLITGSIVNALLFISVRLMGIESAFLLCLIPSLISIYTGLLPLALAPMIPFIMTGNALMVLVFYSLKKKGFWFGAIPSAFVKFIFIWLAGTVLAGSVLHGIASKVALMISWPQLATAIAGASIAYLFLKIIRKL
ncbi:MAG: iron hydrogenase [Candidatus Staskawiczbacteria bacterium]|nr:iron hydrogenase [Candidatus Staskawiczbacteria bacterium]